jgi:hypothetical protein
MPFVGVVANNSSPFFLHPAMLALPLIKVRLRVPTQTGCIEAYLCIPLTHYLICTFPHFLALFPFEQSIHYPVNNL